VSWLSQALDWAFKGFIVHWLAFKGFIVHFSIIPRRRSPGPLVTVSPLLSISPRRIPTPWSMPDGRLGEDPLCMSAFDDTSLSTPHAANPAPPPGRGWGYAPDPNN
jgi:hypothetical protein